MPPPSYEPLITSTAAVETPPAAPVAPGELYSEEVPEGTTGIFLPRLEPRGKPKRARRARKEESPTETDEAEELSADVTVDEIPVIDRRVTKARAREAAREERMEEAERKDLVRRAKHQQALKARVAREDAPTPVKVPREKRVRRAERGRSVVVIPSVDQDGEFGTYQLPDFMLSGVAELNLPENVVTIADTSHGRRKDRTARRARRLGLVDATSSAEEPVEEVVATVRSNAEFDWRGAGLPEEIPPRIG